MTHQLKVGKILQRKRIYEIEEFNDRIKIQENKLELIKPEKRP